MGVTHLSSLEVSGVPTQGVSGTPLFTGNWFFVDAVNGSDGNTGAADNPLATVYMAFSKMTSGNNDVCVIVGSGSTAGTQRLSVANAKVATPAATTGTLTWNKNACHLIGMTAPTMTGQRARFAPPTGTYTQATFGSANFIVVSGQGCYFANFSVFNGFSAGGTNQIAWTDSGGRNYYENVDIQGMADAESAADAGSRSLLITGTTGENTFVSCTIGTDTVARGAVANASVEFAGGTPRNTFRKCHFPMQASASNPLYVLGTGASCMDRWQAFESCNFINNIKSTSTQLTVAMSLTNASPGGLILLDNCNSIGATKWGDTNALANTYVNGPIIDGSKSGLALNPS